MHVCKKKTPQKQTNRKVSTFIDFFLYFNLQPCACILVHAGWPGNIHPTSPQCHEILPNGTKAQRQTWTPITAFNPTAAFRINCTARARQVHLFFFPGFLANWSWTSAEKRPQAERHCALCAIVWWLGEWNCTGTLSASGGSFTTRHVWWNSCEKSLLKCWLKDRTTHKKYIFFFAKKGTKNQIFGFSTAWWASTCAFFGRFMHASSYKQEKSKKKKKKSTSFRFRDVLLYWIFSF